MGRWKHHPTLVTCVTNEDGKILLYTETVGQAIAAIDAHNADYAALEAERDQWKRRCEKIVKATNSLAPECHCCDYDADEQCLVCEGIDYIIAIAEGRE